MYNYKVLRVTPWPWISNIHVLLSHRISQYCVEPNINTEYLNSTFLAVTCKLQGWTPLLIQKHYCILNTLHDSMTIFVATNLYVSARLLYFLPSTAQASGKLKPHQEAVGYSDCLMWQATIRMKRWKYSSSWHYGSFCHLIWFLFKSVDLSLSLFSNHGF